MDWLSTQAVPHGDEQLNDLWVSFMAEQQKAGCTL